jgi:hypothetical protein
MRRTQGVSGSDTRPHFGLGLIVAGVSLMGVVPQAGAIPVLPAASLVVLSPPGIDGGQVLPYSFVSNSVSPSFTYQLGAFALPDPTVDTSTNGTLVPFAGEAQGIDAGLILTYEFEVVGGSGTPAPVTVDIGTGWSTSAGGWSGAGAVVGFWASTYGSDQEMLLQAYECSSGILNDGSGAPFNEGGNFNPSQLQGVSPVAQCGLGAATSGLALATNTIYTFTIYAASYEVVLGTESLSGSVSSFLDPSIYVDPNSPDAANESVILSPDVGNQAPPSPAPEPTTLTLVIAGGAVFALMRVLLK